MHSYIASIWIACCPDEVRCLRRMSELVLANWKDISDSTGTINEPLLSCSSFHSCIVLPVEVKSIKVVVSHQFRHLSTSLDRVFSFSRWELGGSKWRSHQCDTTAMVVSKQSLLNLRGRTSKWVISWEEIERIEPNISHVHRALTQKESQDQDIVLCMACKRRNSDFPRYRSRWPPLVNSIYVAHELLSLTGRRRVWWILRGRSRVMWWSWVCSVILQSILISSDEVSIRVSAIVPCCDTCLPFNLFFCSWSPLSKQARLNMPSTEWIAAGYRFAYDHLILRDPSDLNNISDGCVRESAGTI